MNLFGNAQGAGAIDIFRAGVNAWKRQCLECIRIILAVACARHRFDSINCKIRDLCLISFGAHVSVLLSSLRADETEEHTCVSEISDSNVQT